MDSESTPFSDGAFQVAQNDTGQDEDILPNAPIVKSRHLDEERIEEDHIAQNNAIEDAEILSENDMPKSRVRSTTPVQVEEFELYEADDFMLLIDEMLVNSITRTLLDSENSDEIADSDFNLAGHTGDLIIIAHAEESEVDPYNNLFGTNGVDVLAFTIGMDKAFFLGGDDVFGFSTGADIIYGGAGDDTYDLSAETFNFTVDLSSNTSRYEGGSDTVSLHDVENVIGGHGNDTIKGDSNDNVVNGGVGNDTIVGSAGNDTLDGGAGTNTLDYSAQTSDLKIDLSSNSAIGTGIATDTVSNFSILRTGSGNDSVTGTTGTETFYDGAGDDVYNGVRGSDIFYAGAGDDTYDAGSGWGGWIYFTSVTADVTISFLTNTAFSTETGTDALDGIRNVVGGDGNDTITGSSCPTYNHLYGGAGDDTISGTNNGNGLYGGTGSDTLTGGSGGDDFFFMAADNFDGVDTITNFDVSEGDTIDISDLLSGYNHGTDDIDDFVAFVVSGGDVRIEVDVDGTGTDAAFAAVAIVTGGAALDMDTLIAASDLIIA